MPASGTSTTHISPVFFAPKALDRVSVHVRIVSAFNGVRCRLLGGKLNERIALVLEHSDILYRAELAKVLVNDVISDKVRLEASAVNCGVGGASLVKDVLVVCSFASDPSTQTPGCDGLAWWWRLTSGPIGSYRSENTKNYEIKSDYQVL